MTDVGPSSVEADPAATSKPTGLKQVLEVIPERCYERSTTRGLGIVLRDVVMYGLVMWGLFSTDNPLLLVPLWLASGLVIAALFVVGHDAAHQALFDSKKLNSVVARFSMLPSLHATEVWVFGHNRVHHGHTLRQGMDFVWHPLTVTDYKSLGRVGKLRHRFEWGPLGSGAYYVREIWWNKMVRFPMPPRWRKSMRRDKALVGAFAVATLVAAIVMNGPAGLWLWAKMLVIPFLLFSHMIGWVVYVHHIAPEIRWWPRREWNRFRGQIEGTTILWGPRVVDALFHWIMIHVPHHVDMAIPCYRLPEAAKAIAAAYPDDVVEGPLRISDYRRSVRVCKLYDFDAGHWLPYPSPTTVA